MTYRLALLSEIALVEREGRFWSLDLWIKDLQAQADAVVAVTLFSPVAHEAPAGWVLLPVPDAVKVVPLPSTVARVASELEAADVIQIPGNFTWRDSRRARIFARLGRRSGKPVVLGISSDRATTTLVNARGKSLLHRARARLRSFSVRHSQRYLAEHSDGTFVVGEGLRRLVESSSPNIFVGTASWIRTDDIVPASALPREAPAIHLCVAARLEKMKGISLALDAMAALGASGRELPPLRLAIAGQGPEEAVLRQRCEALQLQDVTRFLGSFAYPGPFFEMLRGQDIVVLSNLNDEQPRLVFDAISQGCLIVCPDSLPYRALGIPARLLYPRGDARALADAIARAIDSLDDDALRAQLDKLVRNATIESMHERRREWVQSTLIDRRPAQVAEHAGT